MPLSEKEKEAKRKEYQKEYQKKYKKEKTEMIMVSKGTVATIKNHLELLNSKESIGAYVRKAVKTQIELDDEMYGVTTDMSGYIEKKKPQSEEPLYYSVTSNPNELQSVGGTKYLPTAMRMAKALGKEYVIVAYNDVSGARKYILKMNEKGDWVKTDEFDI